MIHETYNGFSILYFKELHVYIMKYILQTIQKNVVLLDEIQTL